MASAEPRRAPAHRLRPEIRGRFQAAKFLVSGGYMLHLTECDRVGLEGTDFVEAVVEGFEGFFLSLGTRW